MIIITAMAVSSEEEMHQAKDGSGQSHDPNKDIHQPTPPIPDALDTLMQGGHHLEGKNDDPALPDAENQVFIIFLVLLVLTK
jgi:hypothetical protein